MRPYEGFMPNRPENAAGIRVEPPPSLAVAAGTSPAATAAADPPDDPPGVRETSHGLRVVPQAFVDVKHVMPNSGAAVLPTGTAPAARRPRQVHGVAVDRRAVLEQQRAVRGRHAGAVLQILHADRHAGERPRVLAPRDGRVDRLG
jgi:hypothetical protein